MRNKGDALTPLQALLGRFKQLRPPQGSVIDVFIQAAHDVCGVSLKREHVRYTVATRTIGVVAPGPMKSELALKKGAVLAACAKVLGTHTPTNIV